MNFDFSDEQKSLKEELRRYLAKASPTTEVRKVLEGEAPYNEAVWKGLAELGVLRCRTVADYSGALHFYPYSQRFAWELQMYEKTSGDPVWPFSLWRGGDGVNWAVARQVFPQLAHIL